MRFGAILAGLIFLFNPHVNIIDVLPDAIGYGLLLYGFLPISRVDGNFSEGGRQLRNLFILSLVKIPALYIFALVADDGQLWVLLFSMVFGALEIFFGIKAWLALFEGISYLGNAEEQHGVFDKLRFFSRLTLIFTVAKPLLAVLPDLTLLSSNQYGEVTAGGIQSLSRFRGLFTVIAVAIVLVLGIVWLVQALRYFRSVRREDAFVKTVNDKAATYFEVSKTVEFRYYLLALLFLSVAFLFSFEMKIEGYSFIPPMISAVIFFIFFFMIKKYYPKDGKLGLFASIAYFVTSFAAWIMLVIFADQHYTEDVGGGFADMIYYRVEADFDVFDQLLYANIVVLLSQIAYVTMLVAVFRMMRSIIATHTGVVESLLPEREISDVMRERDADNDKKIKAALMKPLKVFLGFGILTSVSSAIFPMLQIYFNSFFMIDLVIRIVFVAIAYSYVGKLRQAVRVKGGLDYE